jgi:CRISPR system Cascade subunit CasE
VWGYSRVDHRALVSRAREAGDPRAAGICDLDRLASKPMPAAFRTGMLIGFDVRVCPVRRVSKRGNLRAEHAEVDAFLAKAWQVDRAVPLSREEVYRGWLAEQLERSGGARLKRASLTSYRLTRLHRQTHADDRKRVRVTHPDATFDGALEVVDPGKFAALLARGVGRHRAFGFGMLLLKRAASL